jgi:hypothetical protein
MLYFLIKEYIGELNHYAATNRRKLGNISTI